MGDDTEKLVAEEVPAGEAPTLAEKLVDWLISREIIQPEKTDSVLGSEEGGYPPGPNWSEAVDDWNRSPGELRTNGLEVITERRVFYARALDVYCPACDTEQFDRPEVMETVGEWHEGNDDASIVCRECEQEVPLEDWEFDPPWAFGHLGLVFYNWPALSEAFIRACEDQLGYELTRVYMKI